MAKRMTQTGCEKLQPKTSRFEVSDTVVSGLRIVVFPSGSKSWVFRFRSDGLSRKLTLGKFQALHGMPEKLADVSEPMIGDALTLKDARQLGRVAAAAAARGQDPAATKKAAREKRIATGDRDRFGVVARDFVNRYCKPNLRSWHEVARLLGLRPDPTPDDPAMPAADRELVGIAGGFVARWGRRRVASITDEEIIEEIDRIATDHPTAANRHLAALRKCFSWAVEKRKLTVSPCKDIVPPGAEVARARLLTADELRWFWAACEKMGPPFGPMFELMLLTGARLREVGHARYAEIEDNLWTLPGSRTKNSLDHLVPLPPLAVSIIDDLPPPVPGTDGYLFATNRTGGKRPPSGFSRAKRTLDALMLETARKEAGERRDDPGQVEIEAWRLHDLRRVFASGLAALEVQPHVIEAALNHTSGVISGVARVYNRHSYLPEKTDALARWARHIEARTTPNVERFDDHRSRAGGRSRG